jgi:aldehyde dehydrogenase (NAD+)
MSHKSIMSGTFTYQFNTPVYQGTATIHTGLYIDGKWVDSVEKGTIDVINPVTGDKITTVSGGSSKDVDVAAEAAKKAYKTSWGAKVPGAQRGALLFKLADLLEQHAAELAALEALDVGKAFTMASMADVPAAISCARYFAGWADKIQGKTLESNDMKMSYTRHEPFGVVGAITPWNFPLVSFIIKLAPALACGNTVVMKPSEVTPLSALRVCSMFEEAGFPPGVVNVVNGYGHAVGQAMSEHPIIAKISFTGSTLTGRKIMETAAKTNLKNVTLELGGKSPTIVFNDADLDQAVKWAAHGIFFNQGQVCVAGSRIFVQAGIYDEFLQKFTAHAQALKLGDPFEPTTYQGPQVSQTQYERVMGYINAGKTAGATVHSGGSRHGTSGYFVEPTIFTDCKPDMKIVREEIFGPVAVVIKFGTEEEVVAMANDTSYGLAGAVFTQNINQAIRVAQNIEAGTVSVNSTIMLESGLPFGGYKQSGIGRESGEYALATYTQIKAVQINLGVKL